MLNEHQQEALIAALERTGLRSTKQREHVFDVLLTQRDHPTADEVFARAREQMPTISLATVYNCLETLVKCGLVRLVNYEREPTRYCPNLTPHAHFHDKNSGRVVDIDLPAELLHNLQQVLPERYKAEAVELIFHGQVQGNTDN